MSRRSAFKIASGASFLVAWFVAGCSNSPEVDPTIKTEAGKTAQESIRGRVGQEGPKAPPGPAQRVKGGPE